MGAIRDYVEDGRRIAPEHAAIHARLENWARWCKSHAHIAHAFSLEGNYRAPRGAEFEWETATPPPTPLAMPDDLDGLLLEHVVRLLPRLNKSALKFAYLFRADYKFCCRRLGLRYEQWGEHLYRSRQMVINGLLTRLASRPIIPPTIRTSAQAR